MFDNSKFKNFKTYKGPAVKTANQWDSDGTCPDSVAGESWDYADNADVTIDGNRVIILDHSVNVGNLVIEDGGKLIFKDLGEGSEVIKLRAKSIKIGDGEMWIGSRSCRYQGNADVVLYGNRSRVYFLNLSPLHLK